MKSKLTIIPMAILFAAGCSDDNNNGSGTTGGATSLTTVGGAKASGGGKATGGASAAGSKSTGGAATGVGGNSSTSATGGMVATTGGATTTGGTHSTVAGGTATGGTTATLSSGLGGAITNTGGAASTVTGGAPSTTGGAPNTTTGGVAATTGGASHTTTTGGAAVTTGGASQATTGGASTSTGGVAATTGGASSTTGGAAVTTGGASATTGGASAVTGGASATTGGATATGGAATTGGASATTGGATATGGAATTGGATSTAAIGIVSGPAPATYWQATTVTSVTEGTADVTVDDSSAAQTWEGFGGSFNEMGWNYLTTVALQSEAIELLFGTDGAHFVIGRIPMGASDYSMDRYTLDDTGSDVIPDATESNRPPADPTLSQFSIERDTQRLIPYVQAALTVNPNLRLWASPWTPPVWMKTGYKKNSGAPSGGDAVRPSYYDGGYMKSDATTLNSFAQYFVKFLNAYKDRGITIETVAPQNEPNFDQNYPSCLWDPSTYTTFVNILGPALAAATLDTKIMLGTMSNATGDPDIVTSVMGDSTASGLVSSIGVQWGMTANVTSYRSSYGLPIWVTEHRCGNYPWQTSTYVSERAPNDQAYAQESWGYIRDAIKAGVTAYNAWNMVLDPVGKGIDTSRDWAQNSLLVVENGQIVKTPTYFVFRHVSQYVQPGALVVATSGASASDTLAFKNPDGSVVAVMYNSGAAKTSIVQIAGKKLQFSLPQNGWATVVSQ